MPAPPARSRVAAASASNSGSSSGVRSAIGGALAVDGGLVAADDRAGECGAGAQRGPVVDRGADERDERLARTPAVAARRSAAPSSVVEEVRGDRRRRRGRRRGPRRRWGRGACPRARASASASAQRTVGRACDRRSRRPANGARPWATVISGCRPNASWGARTSRPVAPEQWPTSRPSRARSRARGGHDLGVRDAEQHDVRVRAVEAAPERALDGVAGGAQRTGERRAQAAPADDRDRALHISVQPPNPGCRSR